MIEWLWISDVIKKFRMGFPLHQALVESGKEFALFMEDLNYAQEGLFFSIRVHRVKSSPVQNLDFISDDIASISMELDVLADTSISGGGVSKFMEIELIG